MSQLQRLFIVFSLILSVNIVFAQILPSEVNNSPYSVIYNHLYYLQTDTYQPERAMISLPADQFEKEEKAVKLKQILDGRGLFIDLNRLPKNSNYVDSLTGESVYFVDKNRHLLYLERIDSVWSYSRTTMDELESMHQKLYPFGTDFITSFHTPVWQFKILSLEVWKWLGLIILLILFAIMYFAFNAFTKFVSSKVLSKRVLITEDINVLIVRFSRLISLMIGVHFLLYFLPMFRIAPWLNATIIKFLNIFNILLIILTLKSLVSIAFNQLELYTRKTKNKMDDQLLPIMERLIRIVIWTFGIIYILDYLNVNITALLAGISIGGLALALAAQDTVKNFFGSIMIFLDKPFEIGDRVHFNNVDGTVEEVGVRATRVRTFGNSITYVPNAILAHSIIDNKGLRKFRRFKTDIGITYDTPPEIIDKFVEGIRQIIKMHPYTRKDSYEVHLSSFEASSINILVYIFFTVESWSEELVGKHQIFTAIIKLADKLDVSFAFPSQSLYLESIAETGPQSKRFRKPQKQVNQDLKTALEDIETYFKENKQVAGLDKAEGDE